jgi:hypothetical protein
VADAQKQYAREPHDGEPAGEYALKVESDPTRVSTTACIGKRGR